MDRHLGDPAIDLGLAYGFLPPAARRAFRAADGPIDETTWRVARFKALHHATATLVYAGDVNDEDLADETSAGLRNLWAGP